MTQEKKGTAKTVKAPTPSRAQALARSGRPLPHAAARSSAVALPVLVLGQAQYVLSCSRFCAPVFCGSVRAAAVLHLYLLLSKHLVQCLGENF